MIFTDGVENYFDNNATTYMPRHVVQRMLLAADSGNPSSIRHLAGQKGQYFMNQSRNILAKVLRVSPDQITFTSGATEANNMAIHSAILRFKEINPKVIPHVVTSKAEHPSVENTLVELEKRGEIKLTRVGVERNGLVLPKNVEVAVTEDTALVTIIHAHGETGGINNIAKIARLVKAKNRNVVVHSDCTQSAGKLNFWPFQGGLGVDCFSASGHKLYGPKGIGVFVSRMSKVFPFVVGGPQENNRRAGTENVMGAYGMAVAFYSYARRRKSYSQKLRRLKMLILGMLEEKGLLYKVFGPSDNKKLPHVCHIAVSNSEHFCNVLLVEKLSDKGFCVSVGSACSTQSKKASAIMTEMGIDPVYKSSTLRISLGIYNTEESCVNLVNAIEELVHSNTCRK